MIPIEVLFILVLLYTSSPSFPGTLIHKYRVNKKKSGILDENTASIIFSKKTLESPIL